MKRQEDWLLICVVFSFLINFGIILDLVEGQKLPPPRYDGFVYTKSDFDSIKIEAFFDPVCPDTRDAWPSLKQALHVYGSSVSLHVHLLPLPYHDNAYVASRALHIANQLNSSSTFPLLEHFFKYQERFYNDQTRNLSGNAVLKEIVEFVSAKVGKSFYSAIESGFKDRQTDLITRVSFKYSCSRGVSGTPTFFVNGFVLPDAGSPLNFNGWKKVIEPLLASKKGDKNEADELHLLM